MSLSAQRRRRNNILFFFFFSNMYSKDHLLELNILIISFYPDFQLFSESSYCYFNFRKPIIISKADFCYIFVNIISGFKEIYDFKLFCVLWGEFIVKPLVRCRSVSTDSCKQATRPCIFFCVWSQTQITYSTFCLK